MHELLTVSETLPVPAGTSPFRARGYFYLRLLERVQREDGGLARLLSEVKDPSLPDFLSQRFSWNGWYDVLPTMPVYVALARLHRRDFEELVFERNRRTALEMVPSMFQFALQAVSPTLFAGAVMRMVMSSVDFTRVTFPRLERAAAIAEGAGIPRFVAPNLASLVLGFFTGWLELTGATHVEARCTDVRPDGERGGLATVALRFDFCWTP